jgi:hypothetical protein
MNFRGASIRQNLAEAHRYVGAFDKAREQSAYVLQYGQAFPGLMLQARANNIQVSIALGDYDQAKHEIALANRYMAGSTQLVGYVALKLAGMELLLAEGREQEVVAELESIYDRVIEEREYGYAITVLNHIKQFYENSLKLFIGEQVTQIDERVDNEMSAHEVSCLAVKANQQCAKLINPGKRPLAGKAQFVDFSVEQPFGSAFGLFAGAFVFWDVRNDLVVEARPAGRFGIESRIRVEVAANNPNAQALDELEGGAEIVLQLVSVVVIARDNACGCQNETLRVGNGQHIRRFGFLASLIRHRFTAFLGWRVAAIQVEVVRVDLLSDAQNAVLEYTLQAAIPAPLAVVVVDRIIADLFFERSAGSGSIGKRSH